MQPNVRANAKYCMRLLAKKYDEGKVESSNFVFVVTCSTIIVIFPSLSVCLPVFWCVYAAYQISLIITVIAVTICTPVKNSSVEFTLVSRLSLMCVP